MLVYQRVIPLWLATLTITVAEDFSASASLLRHQLRCQVFSPPRGGLQQLHVHVAHRREGPNLGGA